MTSTWYTGKTNAPAVNVRDAINGSMRIEQLPSNMPVLVTDSEDPGWYKMHVGNANYNYGYVKKQFITLDSGINQLSAAELVAAIAKRYGEVSTNKQALGMGTDPESQWCQWFCNHVVKMAGLASVNNAWINDKHVGRVLDYFYSVKRVSPSANATTGAIFYTKNDVKPVAHCGIVLADNGSTITVADGNSKDQYTVTIRDINKSSTNLLGYGWPNGI